MRVGVCALARGQAGSGAVCAPGWPGERAGPQSSVGGCGVFATT